MTTAKQTLNKKIEKARAAVNAGAPETVNLYLSQARSYAVAHDLTYPDLDGEIMNAVYRNGIQRQFDGAETDADQNAELIEVDPEWFP